jgi:hypothetical protein
MAAGRPGNLPGAWFNVIVCAVITVAGVSSGGPFLVIPGIVLEALFIRILIEIYKERRGS